MASKTKKKRPETMEEAKAAGRPWQRTNGFLSVSQINGGERGVLDLRNVVFLSGGSLFRFIEPNIFEVWHCFPIGQEPKDWDGNDPIRRYEGVWINLRGLFHEAPARGGEGSMTEGDRS